MRQHAHLKAPLNDSLSTEVGSKEYNWNPKRVKLYHELYHLCLVSRNTDSSPNSSDQQCQASHLRVSYTTRVGLLGIIGAKDDGLAQSLARKTLQGLYEDTHKCLSKTHCLSAQWGPLICLLYSSERMVLR